MKGYSPFTKTTDPVKKPVGPVTPATQAEYMKREIWNKVEKNKPKDDDSDVMTPEQETKHRAKVLEYNKRKAKPLNQTQKNKIEQQLRGMDPKDPEAQLLGDMLNLKKNQSSPLKQAPPGYSGSAQQKLNRQAMRKAGDEQFQQMGIEKTKHKAYLEAKRKRLKRKNNR